MTFYEQELRKIIGEQYPDATYVGRVCYVRLSDMNRAKIQFVTGSVANQYNALQLTILNRSEGQVDTLRLRFSDLLGTKVTSNPNFRNGVDPHIWDDYGKVLFNELVLSDKLFEHCAEIEEAARKRMELIVPKLAKQYGVTEQLKADNQMEWVRQMNACKAQAEEIVKAELIYD